MSQRSATIASMSDSSLGRQPDEAPGASAPDKHRGHGADKPKRRVGDWASWLAAAVLLLLLPVSVACSVLLLLPLGVFWPQVYWVAALYYALGLLVFVPGIERAYWQLVFVGSRQARADEMRRLKPAWDRVAASSGRNDAHRYDLRVVEADEVNAMAAGGRQVFVTTAALGALPDETLPGLLAHELGHHVGLHPIVLAVECWWMRPVIAAQNVAAALSMFARSICEALSGVAILSFIARVVAAAFYLLAGLLYGVAQVAHALLRFAGRSTEYRADRYAAQIGFGHELAMLLQLAAEHEAGAGNGRRRSMAEVLADTHPPAHKRLKRLRRHLS